MFLKSLGVGAAVGLVLAHVGTADEVERVTIRGETFDVWPVADLRARGLDVPSLPRDQNAAWAYLAAANAYEELPRELSDAFDYAVQAAWPEGADGLADYLAMEGNRKAMQKVREASALDRCQMPYFGDPNQSVIAVLLPNLSPMRFLGKLIVAEGRRLEASGDVDGAGECYLLAMGIGEHVAQGRTLIEGLVGMAIGSLANRALVDAVLRRDLSAQQLRRIESELDRRATRLPTVRRGLDGERQFGPIMVDEMCARPFRFLGGLSEMMGSGGQAEDGSFYGLATSKPSDGWGKLELRIGQLILPDRAIKQHMEGYYARVLDRAASGPASAAAMDFDDERYIEAIPKWDVVSRTLLPSLSRATLLGERCRTELALTRAAIALRLRMLQNRGQAPEILEEATEHLPDGAVEDPFSGRLLRYRRDAEGWVIYSIGPNLADDGGLAGDHWEKLDIVRCFPPEPVEPFESVE